MAQELLAEQQLHLVAGQHAIPMERFANVPFHCREEVWRGSWRQSSGLRNTNRIEAAVWLGEGAR